MSTKAGSGELRFDGRVAIVTGAGRALGRAQALELAERGAKVVVNDLGGGPDGTGADASPAAQVVAEITERGGEAIANTASVADRAAMQALVADTLERFGRIDAVINNAGILTVDDFETLPLEVYQRHLDVHLIGSLNVTQAAWPHFLSQSYGRAVVTISAGMLGSAGVPSYASAKGGLLGLMRALSQIGEPHGIKVNAFSPSAYTRLVGDPELRRRAGIAKLGTQKEGRGQPNEVAPAALLLAHEACPATGEIIASTGTNVARWFIASTRGHTQTNLTMEAILKHWQTVCDETDYFVPKTTAEHAAARAQLSL